MGPFLVMPIFELDPRVSDSRRSDVTSESRNSSKDFLSRLVDAKGLAGPHLSLRTIRRLQKRRVLPFYRLLGTRVVFDPQEVEETLKRHYRVAAKGEVRK